MDNEKFRRHLIDIIARLKELAKNAKKDADNPKEGFKDFNDGMIMGYYSIISLLKHQAFAFCIDQHELGLADMIPDIDLLGAHRNPGIAFEEDNWAIEVMSKEKVKGYLYDSIVLLKEQAREAKEDADNPEKGFEDYNKGSAMAYSSTFSLLKRGAIRFKIDEKELGLADIELI